MKKIFFAVLSILVISLFSSCIINSSGNTSDKISVYSEPWFDTEGYVISKKSERTNNDVFVSFEEGEHPEGEYVAVRYEHSYVNRPRCTFEVQKLTTDVDKNIVSEYITDSTKTENFIISKTPETKIQGFVFWCDEDTVYVVNDLYRYGYSDAKAGTAQYKFKITINGIKTLPIYMSYKSGQIY